MLWRRRRGYARERDEMILVFVVLALGYMRGWLRSRARPAQAVGAWRAAGFLLGLVLIWIAVGLAVCIGRCALVDGSHGPASGADVGRASLDLAG